MVALLVGFREWFEHEVTVLHRREVERVASKVQVRGTRTRNRRGLQVGDSGGEAGAIFLCFLEDFPQLLLSHFVFHPDDWGRR